MDIQELKQEILNVENKLRLLMTQKSYPSVEVLDLVLLKSLLQRDLIRMLEEESRKAA